MNLASRRRRLFVAALVGAVLLLLEGLAHLAMALLARDPRFDFTPVHERMREMQEGVRELLDSQGEALVALDDELGWVYAADYRSRLYSSNSFGLRGRREYTRLPPEGGLRIAAFGDSFVHGNEVSDAECWSAQLEAADPRIEVLNYGVGGYGTDQALLYSERRGRELGATVAVLGFVEVDYARNVNRFRRFLAVHELPLFKPRFALRPGASGADALELIPNPFPGAETLRDLLREPSLVRRAAERDWFYAPLIWSNPLYDWLGLVRLASTVASDAWRAQLRPDGLYRGGRLNTDSEAFAVLVALVERFARGAGERGQHAVLMIFPGRESDVWGEPPRTYQPLLERAAGLASLHVLDLADALRRDGAVSPANWLEPSRHFGPEANHTVALALRELVLAEGWLPAAD